MTEIKISFQSDDEKWSVSFDPTNHRTSSNPFVAVTTMETVEGTATPVGQKIDLRRDGTINTLRSTIARLERQILELRKYRDEGDDGGSRVREPLRSAPIYEFRVTE